MKNKSTAIILTILGLILLIFLINFIKDRIISWELSKIFKMPVTVSGINFNLNKIFTSDRKLEIDHIAFGEDQAQINFKKLKFESIIKNSNHPDYCFDGTASFEKVYIGGIDKGTCSGRFNLTCIPYKKRDDLETNIIVRNGKVKIKDTYLTVNANINTPSEKITKVSMNGNLERTYLANILSCMNMESKGVESDVVVPNFQANLEAGEDIDPMKTLTSAGNFILYQGKFTKLDLLGPILDELKIPSNLSGEERKSFDQVTGNFYLANQVTTLNDVKYNSDYLSVNAHGTADFLGNIDFQATAKPLFANIPSKKIQSLPIGSILPQGLVYLRITGTAEAPKVRPDLKAAVVDTVKTKVLDKVLSKVDKSLNKTLNSF